MMQIDHRISEILNDSNQPTPGVAGSAVPVAQQSVSPS
jgi:hypothetical protein